MNGEFNFDEILELPEEEAKAKLRELLLSEGSTLEAAFIGDNNYNKVNVEKLIEDGKIDILIDALYKAISQQRGKILHFSKKDVDELGKKVEQGIATKEEEEMYHQMLHIIMNGDASIVAGREYLNTCLSFIKYSYLNMEYPFSIKDVIETMQMMILGNAVNGASVRLLNYQSNIDSAVSIVNKVAEQRHNAFYKDIDPGTLDPYVEILALLKICQQIAGATNLLFVNPTDIANTLGIDLDYDSDDEDESSDDVCPDCMQAILHNDHEQGVNSTKEDEEMKNFLKD